MASGDGDGFSIGGGHVAHVIRRNIDLTYIVMDNQIYGLTKGQLSPTSPRGRKTVTSNFGSMEDPVNPLLYVLAYGASFVAQGTPADMPGLGRIIEEGIRFPGFAFINVQSPCVTYGEEDATAQGPKGQHAEPANPSATIHPTAPGQPNWRANTAPNSTLASFIATPIRRRPTARALPSATRPSRNKPFRATTSSTASCPTT